MRLIVIAVLSLLSCQKWNEMIGKHWSYEKPEEWGASCNTGRLQSPVDIQKTTHANLESVRIDYSDTPLAITNNGHTIQVNAAGAGGITVGETRFNLVQYHFHARSEHAIQGATADMEVHFVHKDAAGNIAVVGVLLRKGESNPLLKAIVENAPKDKGEKTVSTRGNPALLLPPSRGYYTYVGSLTTPDCSEGLKWIVMKMPVEVSEQEIALFRAMYANNARPVQALNNRIILESD